MIIKLLNFVKRKKILKNEWIIAFHLWYTKKIAIQSNKTNLLKKINRKIFYTLRKIGQCQIKRLYDKIKHRHIANLF